GGTGHLLWNRPPPSSQWRMKSALVTTDARFTGSSLFSSRHQAATGLVTHETTATAPVRSNRLLKIRTVGITMACLRWIRRGVSQMSHVIPHVADAPLRSSAAGG